MPESIDALADDQIRGINETIEHNSLEPHQKQLLRSMRTVLVMEKDTARKVAIMWPWFRVGRWAAVAVGVLQLSTVWHAIEDVIEHVFRGLP